MKPRVKPRISHFFSGGGYGFVVYIISFMNRHDLKILELHIVDVPVDGKYLREALFKKNVLIKT